ncbi:MAG: flagellar basal body rod protein FlgF [Gammaproteobacteria bacterium]|nr:flagellar basal body rod protein FlgF [Gammaproteobacteria bacterium]MBQ0839508.1 flagellar basal body rod protein FlgF [Gammaproteobacteria bacterium]
MGNYLYTSMVSASQIMRGMADVTHNLANASTTGFRADLAMFKSVTVPGAVNGGGAPVYERVGIDTTFGALQNTGVDLDVAVSGDGWIAVEASGGGEAYTRRGDLRLDANGQLTNGAGQAIIGDGGLLAIPPHTKMEIAADGTISIQPLGQGPDTVAVVGRIKLVSLNSEALYKDKSGLLRLKDGATADEDAGVSLISGSLETSNVNTISTMVKMIELQRSYETQIKMMKTAADNDRASAALMKMN